MEVLLLAQPLPGLARSPSSVAVVLQIVIPAPLASPLPGRSRQ